MAACGVAIRVPIVPNAVERSQRPDIAHFAIPNCGTKMLQTVLSANEDGFKQKIANVAKKEEEIGSWRKSTTSISPFRPFPQLCQACCIH
jgi:hypothetical protein